MDRHGWVEIAPLIAHLNTSRRLSLTKVDLQHLVAADEKGRYRISQDGNRIKACQGHSIPWVEPELEIRTPPEYLHHGTTTEALKDILASGAIMKMNRHAVHMQSDFSKAWQSATRRSGKTPVVLKISTPEMLRDGFIFSISENEVWFCESIPTIYIREFIYTHPELG